MLAAIVEVVLDLDALRYPAKAISWLLPVTYAITAILLVFGVTVMVADVVNPVRLF